MFRKPYKVKSNIQLKNSEKKAFRTTVLKQFSSVTNTDIDFLMKESITTVKLTTHSNDIVLVYVVNKRPMFFTVYKKLYPTIFMLWQLPNLVPGLTTHTIVLERISSGADLMLPGVLTPEKINRYGNIDSGMSVCINTKSNKAAFAVGEALLSSMQMLYANEKGKCVKIVHTFGDNLCKLESVNLQMPNLGSPDWVLESLLSGNEQNMARNIDHNLFTEIVSNEQHSGHAESTHQNNICVESSENLNDDNAVIEDNCEDEISDGCPLDDMNYLIKYCFLKVMKETGKSLSLPIKFSNFNKNMLDACPSNRNLEIKKTIYKKVSIFLKQMGKDGFISYNEQPKGVENITAINFAHPEVKSFVLLGDDMLCKETSDIFQTVLISEEHTICAAVLPLFKPIGFKKGDVMPTTVFRQHVTNYIKEKDLHDKPKKGMITPNEELASILKSDQPLSWEEIMQKLIRLMGSCYTIKTPDGRLVKGKGMIDTVSISVVTRSGNKKVTLIDNLELYGINVSSFAKECQHGVAASTSISKPPGKKYNQLLVQGNQVQYVGVLLLEKYKIPKKYVTGLELAPKKR